MIKTQTLVDLEEAIELLEDRSEGNSATSNIKEDNDAFDAELDALMQDFEDKNTEELNGDGKQSKSMDTNSSDTKKIANAETDVSQTQNNTVDKASVKSGVDDSEDAIEAEFASLMEQVDKVEDERVLDKSKSTTKQQSEENENQTSNSSKNTQATSTQNQIDEPERIPTEQNFNVSKDVQKSNQTLSNNGNINMMQLNAILKTKSDEAAIAIFNGLEHEVVISEYVVHEILFEMDDLERNEFFESLVDALNNSSEKQLGNFVQNLVRTIDNCFIAIDTIIKLRQNLWCRRCHCGRSLSSGKIHSITTSSTGFNQMLYLNFAANLSESTSFGK